MPAKEFIPLVVLGDDCPGEPSRDLGGLLPGTLTSFLLSARQGLASRVHIPIDDGESFDICFLGCEVGDGVRGFR
jgi:hypothetical protein